MPTFSKPIYLILIACESDIERQRQRVALQAEEYVFVEASDVYKCLDIAECHHPGCVVLDFSMIENNYLLAIQFLHFLDVPIIIIGENIPGNLSQYFINIGIFAIINKPLKKIELHRTVELAIASRQIQEVVAPMPNFEFNLTDSQIFDKTSLQSSISSALAMALEYLSELISCEIEFAEPVNEAFPPLLLQKKLAVLLGDHELSVAQLDFSGNFSGSAQILLSIEAADALVLNFIEEECSPEEFTQSKADILAEIGNVAINGAIGTLSNAFNYQVQYATPKHRECSTAEILYLLDLSYNSTIVLSRSHFQIKDLEIDGNFFPLFSSEITPRFVI